MPVWLISFRRGNRASSASLICVRSRIKTKARRSEPVRQGVVTVFDRIVEYGDGVACEFDETRKAAHGILIIVRDDDVDNHRLIAHGD